MMEWINADERLPTKSGKYLVYCEDGFCAVTGFSTKWNKFNASDISNNCEHAFYDVTHWAEIEVPEHG